MLSKNMLGMLQVRVMTWVGLLLMPVSCYRPMSQFRTDLFLGDGFIGDYTPIFYPDQHIYSTSYPAATSSGGAIGTAQSRVYLSSTENSQHAAIPCGSQYRNPVHLPQLEDANGHGSASLFSPDQFVCEGYLTASDQQLHLWMGDKNY